MFECIKRLIFRDFYNRQPILSEDLLILILDYLSIDDMIEFKKVSPQFDYCVKELAQLKLFLGVCQNRYAFPPIFYTYPKFSPIEKNREVIKNSIIRLEPKEQKRNE